MENEEMKDKPVTATEVNRVFEDLDMNVSAACQKCGHTAKLKLPVSVLAKILGHQMDQAYARGVADGRAMQISSGGIK